MARGVKERNVRDAGVLERAFDGCRPELADAPHVMGDTVSFKRGMERDDGSGVDRRHQFERIDFRCGEPPRFGNIDPAPRPLDLPGGDGAPERRLHRRVGNPAALGKLGNGEHVGSIYVLFKLHAERF